MRLRTTLHDQGEEGRPSLLAFYVCLMLAAKYLGVDGAQSAADWSYALYEQFIGDPYMYADVPLLWDKLHASG